MMGDSLIPCSCNRFYDHAPTCNVAQAMRFRCPDCKSLNRKGRNPRILHAHHCKLKELQP